MNGTIIAPSNAMARLRGRKRAAEQVLSLLPSCLQVSKCKQNIRHDLGECKRRGRCKIKDMLDLAEEYGVAPFVATGGRLAAQKAKSDDVKAIVAVACEKELRAGIMAVFPKAVMAVVNMRPNGPCVGTDVGVATVREAIGRFVK